MHREKPTVQKLDELLCARPQIRRATFVLRATLATAADMYISHVRDSAAGVTSRKRKQRRIQDTGGAEKRRD